MLDVIMGQDLNIDFSEWRDSQPPKCVYCDIMLEEFKKLPEGYNSLCFPVQRNVMSIDRIDIKEEYEHGNIVIACFDCKYIRSTQMMSYRHMRKAGKAFFKPRWQKELGLPQEQKERTLTYLDIYTINPSTNEYVNA